MGYHVHITRRELDDSTSINHEEWSAFASASDLFDYYEATKTWTLKGNDSACLWYSEESSEIWTSNPEMDLLEVMINIAQKLSAQVIGDEGEVIDEIGDPGEIRKEERFEQALQKRLQDSKRKKSIVISLLIIGVIAACLSQTVNF